MGVGGREGEDGRKHDYLPDFIVRLRTTPNRRVGLILETKGYDPLDEVKEAAAQRWCAAVNADSRFGEWRFAKARNTAGPTQVAAECAMGSRAALDETGGAYLFRRAPAAPRRGAVLRD